MRTLLALGAHMRGLIARGLHVGIVTGDDYSERQYTATCLIQVAGLLGRRLDIGRGGIASR
jgi:late competence protein required for DNA uptake (superfamily II DNA/RNA helicase)